MVTSEEFSSCGVHLLKMSIHCVVFVSVSLQSFSNEIGRESQKFFLDGLIFGSSNNIFIAPTQYEFYVQ